MAVAAPPAPVTGRSILAGTRPWGKAAPVRARFRHRAGVVGRRLTQRVAGARSALLTTAGLGSGTASFWHTFGTGAGLGALAVSFLVIEALTGKESGG